MKITIESTPELAHANGLPVRVWTGTAERGTPLLVLVTRIAAPDDGHPDDLAELKDALIEPPTRHGVYGETPVIAEPRWCNACRARYSLKKPALFVARDAEGLEWFECGAHDPTDNLEEVVRVVREPIADWFARHELPLPGGVYRGAASQREPWASIVESTLAARLRVAMAICDGLEPQLADPFHCAVNRIRILLAEPEQRDPSAAKDRDKPWLVKDFWSLYRAAEATLSGETPDSHAWLELQLARLRPAFDVCESERRGAPDRLTAAEREALTALHRWLHSPGGDCELIEATQPYHGQVEGESPADCERLEAEEQRAYAGMHEAHSPALTDAAQAALAMARHDEAEKEKACGVVEPPLPHQVITAIVDDDRAGEQTGSTFILCAMRGAQIGWHAKNAHPEAIAVTGRLGAPIDEPARTAWLTGFRLGAGLDPAADLGADETPEAPKASTPGVCRMCKCTDEDCSQCIAKTGEPCAWVEPDLCSACAYDAPKASPELVLTGGNR